MRLHGIVSSAPRSSTFPMVKTLPTRAFRSTPSVMTFRRISFGPKLARPRPMSCASAFPSDPNGRFGFPHCPSLLALAESCVMDHLSPARDLILDVNAGFLWAHRDDF